MANHWIAAIVIITLFSCNEVLAGPHEVRLINDLMENYNAYERPAEVDNAPLKVEFQVTLQQIIDVDEKNQMIKTNIWLKMIWSDYKLRWIPAEYGNVTEIRLPVKLLWKPDILMYNSADPSFDGSWPVNIVVFFDGTVSQQPPGIFTSACPINIRWFPFDEQSCRLKFGSWTYDSTKIDLQIEGGRTSGSLDGYAASGGWDLLGLPGIRNVVIYECCPDDNPYIDLSFYINIRRRKLYYMVNIVTPCLMLAALTLVTFTIPPEAGEKISFAFSAVRHVVKYACCVETYIDITYYINIRRHRLFYMRILILPCMLLSAMTLLIFALPPNSGEKVSFGVTILLSLTVFLLLVAEALPETSDAVPLIALYFACVMMMNAASVVFTVLVLNYHHRTSETHSMPRWVKKGICEWLAWLLRLKRPGHDLKREMICSNRATSNDVEMAQRNSKSLLANVKDEDDYSPSLPRSPNLNGNDYSQHKLKVDARSITSDFSPSRHELRNILKEIRFITDKMKAQDEDDVITSDWKFAATVVDRFLLWFFAIFTVLSSMAILMAAPHMFEPAPPLPTS